MPAAAPPRPRTSPGAPASRTPERAAADATLVRLAAAGDDAAFEALFLRHRPAVQAYAARMLGDHARAEDVVQDVFVSAVCALRAGTEPVHVRAWLREIARRTCIDQWRASTRRGEVSLDAPERLTSGDERRLTDDDSLGRATEDRESVATLRRAFLDLPQLQHAVLVQRELEGRSPDEIAQRLGVSRTVVEGQLARGRRTLARAYRELRSGERCTAARVLGAASLEGPLGVRDRTRLAGHLRACDACRRHARELGVDARLLGGPVVATASLLLPLPLLRRLPVDGLLAGETASGALGAKVLVGAAVLAAGGGGVLVTRDPPIRAWPAPEAAHHARHRPVRAATPGASGAVLTLRVGPSGAAPGGFPAGSFAAPFATAGGGLRPTGAASDGVAASAGPLSAPAPRADAGPASAPGAAPVVAVTGPPAGAASAADRPAGGAAAPSAGAPGTGAPGDARDGGRADASGIPGGPPVHAAPTPDPGAAAPGTPAPATDGASPGSEPAGWSVDGAGGPGGAGASGGGASGGAAGGDGTGSTGGSPGGNGSGGGGQGAGATPPGALPAPAGPPTAFAEPAPAEPAPSASPASGAVDVVPAVSATAATSAASAAATAQAAPTSVPGATTGGPA